MDGDIVIKTVDRGRSPTRWFVRPVIVVVAFIADQRRDAGDGGFNRRTLGTALDEYCDWRISFPNISRRMDEQQLRGAGMH